MVDRRRELNSRLMQIDSISPPPASSTSAGTSESIYTSFEQSPSTPVTKGKERRPNCQRCAQHSVLARLKGHKRCCPFRDCPCAKCQVVQERQKLMADQIKLRRRQKKQKSMDGLADSEKSRSNTGLMEPSTISGCLKCTQQAIAYQQILSFIDPSSALDPATFSAILAACPHKNGQSDL